MSSFFGKLKNASDADRQNYFASEEARRARTHPAGINVSQKLFQPATLAEQLQHCAGKR